MALFFAVGLPIVAGGLSRSGDERFYTDAAIRMVHQGDWLIPYYLADGRPHFNKPILTYWAVGGGYELFGVNFLGARLLFLLAGCLLIGLTYELSLTLFPDRKVALLAAAVLLSNTVLSRSSMSALPDILQTLFMTLSFWGFAKILFKGERSPANYALAYLGAALAVEAKGIPGFLLVAYVFAFCLLARQVGPRCRDLVDWKAMLLGAAVALFWFAAIYLKYGGVAIVGHPRVNDGFISDQITVNITGQPVRPLSNAVFYFLFTASHFLPWTLFLLVALMPNWKVVRGFCAEHRHILLFAFGWYALLFAIFCMGNAPRGRYLLPAFPMLSSVTAALLVRLIAQGKTARWCRSASGVIILIAALVGLACFAAGLRINGRMLAGGVVLTVVAATIWAFWRRATCYGSFVCLAATLLVGLGVYTTFVQPLFQVWPFQAIVRQLDRNGIRGDEVAGVDLPTHAESWINFYSQGRVHVRQLRRGAQLSDAAQYSALILSQRYRKRWDLRGYRLQRCGYALDEPALAGVWKLLHAHDARSALAAQGTAYYIAIRKPDPVKPGGAG